MYTETLETLGLPADAFQIEEAEPQIIDRYLNVVAELDMAQTLNSHWRNSKRNDAAVKRGHKSYEAWLDDLEKQMEQLWYLMTEAERELAWDKEYEG